MGKRSHVMVACAMGIALGSSACGKKDESDQAAGNQPPVAPATPPPAPAADAAPAPAKRGPAEPAEPSPDAAKARRAYADALARGRKLVDGKKPAEAATAFREALAARPDDPVALSELSWALFESGDHEGAIKAASSSIERSADAPWLTAASLYNRGRASEASGKRDAAIADYQRSYELRSHPAVRKQLEQLGARVPESVWKAEPLEGPVASVEDFCTKLGYPDKDDGCEIQQEAQPVKGSWVARELALWRVPWKTDDDYPTLSAALLTDEGWFVLNELCEVGNHMHCEVTKVAVAGNTMAFFVHTDAGKWDTHEENFVLACGRGKSGTPSCFEVSLRISDAEYTGTKENGHMLPEVVDHDCTARLDDQGRLVIAARDAGCRKTGLAGEHMLAFP